MQSAGSYRCVLVTASTLTAARKLANGALNARLAACANLVPKIESHYWWQGRLESSTEVLILFKTAQAKLEALEQFILQNHTYDTPEFLVLPVEAGAEKYLKWITDSVTPPAS
jgi:periplasmic divalent cation tolerance protein